ncbi:TetR/AcrR family transcriptional regulator [Amycolatopsis magusensis]|uniref:TetR/AcrR family transcriptional regulator n=1 Tax=Amycolatopsis magusensis TaxID=882444 RepID=UPI00378C931D
MTTSDGRLLRGARSRQSIVRHAVDMASLEGLNGVTIGRLATTLAMSKSGVQALFGTKEKLQLAAVETAREAFLDAVVRPTSNRPHGVARLRALIAQWTEYAGIPLFPGGCFRAATMAEFDSKPGPIRDALVRDQRDWQNLLAGELRHAVEAGEIRDLDPELAAFQLDAVLLAANSALRLGDEDALAKVHRVVDNLLQAP